MVYVLAWLVLGLPTLLAYLVLMRHALRSGSTGWAVFMLLAPFLGGLIYYFSQYQPALAARRLAYAMEPDPALPPLAESAESATSDDAEAPPLARHEQAWTIGTRDR